MTFEQATRQAAKIADKAVSRAMQKYQDAGVTDEDDLTGVLIGQLDGALDGQIAGLTWDTTILRHRKGVAAQEKRVGADIVIQVKMDTPRQKYSKGVLVQAKRLEPDERLSSAEHKELVKQCSRMLKITPAAFVFDYAKGQMRCGAATRIRGSSSQDLFGTCGWTSYRFFLELFRCPIGDPRINSARVDLLPIPAALLITATGDLD